MIIHKSKRPDWPAFKCYIILDNVVTTTAVRRWRQETKVKCLTVDLYNTSRVYFTSQKDAMFFTMRWA